VASKLQVLAIVLAIAASPSLTCLITPDLIACAQDSECATMGSMCDLHMVLSSNSCCRLSNSQMSFYVPTPIKLFHVAADAVSLDSSSAALLPANTARVPSRFAAASPPRSSLESVSILRI
jgi:hypothetical protein